MNNQEAFDAVARHLAEQKVRSVSDSGDCLYRGPNGLKCAVGALIPDEDYKEEYEFRLAASVAPCVPCLTSLSPSLLTRLQAVHDDCAPEHWTSQLREIAANFNLNTDAL